MTCRDQEARTRAHYQRLLPNLPCPTCEGRMLRPEALAAEVGGHGIHSVSSMSVERAYAFFADLERRGNRAAVGGEPRRG